MRNRIIIITIIIFITIILTFATAKEMHATSTFTSTPIPIKSGPTPTGNANAIENQINNLKDRIASRVAQLNLVEKRGIIGKVQDTTETQLTLVDSSGETRLIDVDELTKFSSPSAKSTFGISDITKGSIVGAIGLYNKDSRHLLARWVDVLNLPQVLSGAILSIDKDNYIVSVATQTSDEIPVEVEDITKTISYSNDGTSTRSGFSKLQVGQRVMVVGFTDANNSNDIIASRLLVFPDLPANPHIPLVKPEDIAPITPSTGSGKKLTPIVK